MILMERDWVLSRADAKRLEAEEYRKPLFVEDGVEWYVHTRPTFEMWSDTTTVKLWASI